MVLVIWVFAVGGLGGIEQLVLSLLQKCFNLKCFILRNCIRFPLNPKKYPRKTVNNAIAGFFEPCQPRDCMQMYITMVTFNEFRLTYIEICIIFEHYQISVRIREIIGEAEMHFRILLVRFLNKNNLHAEYDINVLNAKTPTLIHIIGCLFGFVKRVYGTPYHM